VETDPLEEKKVKLSGAENNIEKKLADDELSKFVSNKT